VLKEGLHVDAELLVVAVDAGPDDRFAPHPGAADPGEDGPDDVFAQGEQGGDGARSGRVEMVAVGPPGLSDQLFAAEFAQVVGGLPGGEPVLPVIAWTLAVNAATVNPSDVDERARTAASATRMRGLFRSTPPTRVAPTWAGVGSRSSRPSVMNVVSTQSRVVVKRSTMSASRAMMCGKLSRTRPQRNALVLCTIASKRSTCSPET
jgi:hypothetical protein